MKRFTLRLVAALVLVLCLALCPLVAQASVYGRGNVSSPYAVTPGEESAAVVETTVLEMLRSTGDDDGMRVTFSAEAVGEAINGADGHYWVNVADRGHVIGVFMTPEQKDLVTNWGGYGSKGSELRIIGTLHTSCDGHGGELDVHADMVAVISPGGSYTTGVSTGKIHLAIGLCAAGLVVWIAYLVRRRMSR